MNGLSTTGKQPPFWHRIKDHKVLQWSQAYLAASLTLVHGEDLIAHSFHWPEFVGQILIGVLAVGFLPAVAVSWYQGHKGMEEISGGEMMIASLLLLIGAGLFAALTHARPQDAPEALPASPTIKRLAILPFENQSPDPANAYFARGIYSVTLAALASRSPELEVISSSAITPYLGHPNLTQEIVRDLGATHVLTGSVRREANDVGVTLELSDARRNIDIWTKNYTYTLQSAFTIESNVANEVAARLSVPLNTTSEKPLTPSSEPEAFERYLKAHLAQPAPDTPTKAANISADAAASQAGTGATVFENVAELPCSGEADLISRFGTDSVRTQVVTRNNTSTNAQLFWIDYAHARQLYAVIRPSEAVAVDTWSTHPWVVTDSSGNCLVAYLPGDQKGQITVR